MQMHEHMPSRCPPIESPSESGCVARTSSANWGAWGLAGAQSPKDMTTSRQRESEKERAAFVAAQKEACGALVAAAYELRECYSSAGSDPTVSVAACER